MLKFKSFLNIFIPFYMEYHNEFLCYAISAFKNEHKFVSWYYRREIDLLKITINGALIQKGGVTLSKTEGCMREQKNWRLQWLHLLKF